MRRRLVLGLLAFLAVFSLVAGAWLGGVFVLGRLGQNAYDQDKTGQATGWFGAAGYLAPAERFKAPYGEGTSRLTGGDLKGAENNLRRALGLVPDSQQCLVRVNLSLALEAQGDQVAVTASNVAYRPAPNGGTGPGSQAGSVATAVPAAGLLWQTGSGSGSASVPVAVPPAGLAATEGFGACGAAVPHAHGPAPAAALASNQVLSSPAQPAALRAAGLADSSQVWAGPVAAVPAQDPDTIIGDNDSAALRLYKEALATLLDGECDQVERPDQETQQIAAEAVERLRQKIKQEEAATSGQNGQQDPTPPPTQDPSEDPNGQTPPPDQLDKLRQRSQEGTEDFFQGGQGLGGAGQGEGQSGQPKQNNRPPSKPW